MGSQARPYTRPLGAPSRRGVPTTYERPVPTLVQPALRRSRRLRAADGGTSTEPRTRPPRPPPSRAAIGPCSRTRRPSTRASAIRRADRHRSEPAPAPGRRRRGRAVRRADARRAAPRPPTPSVGPDAGRAAACGRARGRCRSPTCRRASTPTSSPPSPATSARRGKLRRRIAFLRAARELLLRDLGGFIYELHRTAHDIEHEAHRRLRETKLARLSRVDAELHELEYRLDDVRRQVLVREPGVGGECPHCGELFAQLRALLLQLRPPADRVRPPRARQGPGARRPSRWPDRPVVTAARRSRSRRPAAADQPTQEIAPLDPDHPAPSPSSSGRAVAIDAPQAVRGRGGRRRGRRAAGAPVGETGADVAAAAATASRRARRGAPASTGGEPRGDERDDGPRRRRRAAAPARSATRRGPRRRDAARRSARRRARRARRATARRRRATAQPTSAPTATRRRRGDGAPRRHARRDDSADRRRHATDDARRRRPRRRRDASRRRTPAARAADERAAPDDPHAPRGTGPRQTTRSSSPVERRQ